MLGNRTNLAEAQAAGVGRIKESADAFAANVLPIVRQVQASGVKTPKAIAEALNAHGLKTARGGQWHPTSVQRLLARGI